MSVAWRGEGGGGGGGGQWIENLMSALGPSCVLSN